MTPRLLKTESLAPVTIGRAALHELAASYAIEQFDRHGHVAMTWLLASGYRVAWVETGPDDGDKDRIAAGMRAMMKVLGVHAYAFIAEAWVFAAHNLKDDAKAAAMLEYAQQRGVRNLPKHLRDDVLMISTFDRAGGITESRWLVTERKHGPNFLGPRMDEQAWDTAEGRFWNLLEGL